MRQFLILLLCLFLPLVSLVELYDNFTVKNGDVIITEVVNVEGKSQNTIYKDALLWVNEVFQ